MMNNSVNDYFKRPFSAKFLHAESLGMNNFTSTYPLPKTFKDYKKVTLHITIESVIATNISPIVKKVGFYYVVDTIIQETIRTLLQIMIESNSIELKGLKSLLKNSSKRFILKTHLFEEYLFGDYPICSYETIRNCIREFEPIKLILKVVEKTDVSPNLSKYPPIIFICLYKKYNYNKLMKKYLKRYPDDSIVFRLKPLENLRSTNDLIFRYILQK